MSKYNFSGRVTKDMTLEEARFDLSIRLYGILHNYCPLFKGAKCEITPISELENLSTKEFLSYRGAGKASLKELMELCNCVGIEMLP